MLEMPRRANHEGTVPRKVKGRDLWRVRVMLDGKAYDRYGETPKVASEKVRRLIADHAVGLRPLNPRYTVGEWLDDWLRVYTPDIATRTRQSYSDTVRLYLRPALGKRPLAKLHQDDIAGMLAIVTGKRGPLSATTRRYVYAVLRIALGEAVRQERVHRNVATLMDPPRKSGTVVAPLSPDTADALLGALAGHRHRALLIVALSAGLREGELLGLPWSAVDLERGSIEVRVQLERVSRMLVEPKRESRRRVDLPPEAVEALREHRARQRLQRVGKLDWDPRDFVFTTAAGQPLTPGLARRVLRQTLAGIDLPAATTHQLRHTYATTLLAEGADLFTVSRLLGHRDIGTTANTYGHLTDAQRRDAAERMGRAMRRAR